LNTVAARGTNSSGQSIANTGIGVTLTYNAVKTFDTHGALNTSTGIYTAPETGYYQISASVLYSSSSWTAGNSAELSVLKNGIFVSDLRIIIAPITGSQFVSLGGSDILYIAKGDTINISVANQRTGGATTLYPVANYNYFSITKVSV